MLAVLAAGTSSAAFAQSDNNSNNNDDTGSGIVNGGCKAVYWGIDKVQQVNNNYVPEPYKDDNNKRLDDVRKNTDQICKPKTDDNSDSGDQ